VPLALGDVPSVETVVSFEESFAQFRASGNNEIQIPLNEISGDRP
jgi:hypothetical protein